jgi:hypothetical protein
MPLCCHKNKEICYTDMSGVFGGTPHKNTKSADAPDA